MFHDAKNIPGRDSREGVVLLVVIAMLSLFATVALGFVFYAEGEAKASRYAREALTKAHGDIDPEFLLSYFLGQLIYDTDDLYSAMRGQGLATTMWGYNRSGGQNNSPYTGTGITHNNVTFPANATFPGGVRDEYHMINRQYHEADGWLRDPGHQDFRANPTAPLGAYLGYENPPWTYPDVNNTCIAVVNANGQVILPSFHRPWTGVNWTAVADPWQKYLTLRPHRSYHNVAGNEFADPPMISPTEHDCDVRNLDGPVINPGQKNNDSYWMDLGFPVFTSPNGKKYKALFAPLIIDLDNRVNLMAHGNVKGNAGAHMSNQGWFRSEVALNRALPNTWQKLFLNSTINRYGADNVPGASGPVSFLTSWYGRIDLDGINGGPRGLPSGFDTFPTYPTWYDAATETLNHPAANRYFAPPAGDDRKLMVLSNLEAILRYGGKGSPGLTSALLMELSQDLNNVRNRNLVTLLSMDLARHGMVKYSGAASAYQYSATTGLCGPAGGSSFPAAGQFLNRINLNRPLRPYGTPNTADYAQNGALFAGALQDRQKFALEIWKGLLTATGGQDPNSLPAPVDTTTAEFHAARWLAQLAVNIVDYIDDDDYMTPFLWFNNGTDPAEHVFGTELPRLVINEVHCQADNDADYTANPNLNPAVVADPAARTASRYNLNFWVELHNPLRSTPAGDSFPSEGGRAILRRADTIDPNRGKFYRVLVTRPNTTLNNIAAPQNVKGDPNGAVLRTVDDFPNYDPAAPVAGSFVAPANGAFNDPTVSNAGFYLLGPGTTFLAMPDHPQNRNPFPGYNPTFASPNMNLPFPVADIATYMGAGMNTYDVLLQRLANPYLPESPTNPYITIDYVQNLSPADGILYKPMLATGTPFPIAGVDAITATRTKGRRQPYAGHSSQLELQQPNPLLANSVQHTLFRHNCKNADATASTPDTIDRPFDWLVHMDRPLVSPIELMQVSAFPQHHLMQKFNIGGSKFLHRSFWDNQNTLAYRFLEMADTREFLKLVKWLDADRNDIDYFRPIDAFTDGSVLSGRRPGKININTIWDIDTFRALVDRQAGSTFTDAQVDAIFTALRDSRTPDNFTTDNHRPIKGFGVGLTPANAQYPAGLGIEDTLLRRDATGARIMEVPGAHPYQNLDLLCKIFNNTTTRSNCFAVWVTVGFFEVVDDTARPVKLGKELTSANGVVRHRMFALIDRTELRVRLKADPIKTDGPLAAPAPGQTATGSCPVPAQILEKINGGTWTIQPGVTQVVIAPDTEREETVLVKGFDASQTPPRIQFDYRLNHPYDPTLGWETIIFRAHPGPWPNYAVRLDPKVVPHYSIID